jgi:radical SAM protein with 4Fe4S-binding SPASM domain
MLLQLDITNKCNLRCSFCRRDREKEDKLSLEKIYQILQDARKSGFDELTISGGEPFLSPNLYSTVKKAKDLRFAISITSNGSLPFNPSDGKLVQLLNDISFLQISIDGMPEYHNAIRGWHGAFDSALKFAVFANNYTTVVIKSVVSKNNINELPRLKEELKKAGLRNYSIRPLIPINPQDRKNVITYGEFKRLYFSLSEDGDFSVMSEDPLFNTFCPLIPSAEYKKLGGCLAGINVLYVNTEGNVYPCAYLNIKVGDLTNQTLDEVLENDVIKTLKSREFNGACGTCKLNRFCGGCRAFPYLYTGDMMGSDMRCGWNQ